MSCPVEGCCQVDGHGALAYPSLAAHNGDDAGLGLVAEGWSQLRGAAVKGGEQVLSVFVGHHPEVDPDFFDAFDHLEAVSDLRIAHVPERFPNASLRQTIRSLMVRFSICRVGDNLRWRRATLGVGVSPGPLVYFHLSTSVPTLRPSPIGEPSQAWFLRMLSRGSLSSRRRRAGVR